MTTKYDFTYLGFGLSSLLRSSLLPPFLPSARLPIPFPPRRAQLRRRRSLASLLILPVTMPKVNCVSALPILVSLLIASYCRSDNAMSSPQHDTSHRRQRQRRRDLKQRVRER